MLAELLPKGRGKLVVRRLNKKQEALRAVTSSSLILVHIAWVSFGVLSSFSSGVTRYQTLSASDSFYFPPHWQIRKQLDITDSYSSLDPRLRHAGLVCEICGEDSNLVQLMAPGEAETALEMYMKHHNLIHSSVSFQNQHSFELCGNLKLINNCPCSNSCVSQSQLKTTLQ